jgi:flagellar assembly factor FliW
LPEEVEKMLHLGPKAELGVYSIVRIPDKIKDFTYNLQAPIVVNYQTREADQIVLDDAPYSTREHFESH